MAFNRRQVAGADDLKEIELSGGKNVYNYKDIVMGQYNKITNFFNAEFRGGFYTTVPTKDGNEKLIYIDDTREVLSNSIMALSIILKPKFNKKTMRYYNLTRLRMKKIKEDFLEASSPHEKTILGENFYADQKDKIFLQEYKNQKLDIYIKLFDKLALQLHELKYLEMVGGTF